MPGGFWVCCTIQINDHRRFESLWFDARETGTRGTRHSAAPNPHWSIDPDLSNPAGIWPDERRTQQAVLAGPELTVTGRVSGRALPKLMICER